MRYVKSLFFVVLMPVLALSQSNGPISRRTLWKQDRERIAAAIARGDKKVRLLVASSPGRAQAALGRVVIERTRLTRQSLPVFREILVLPGTSSLSISTRNSSDKLADIDLYLYDCTDVKMGCQYNASSTNEGSDERLRISKPHSGRWVVAIDAYELPHGPINIDFQQVQANVTYGTAQVLEADKRVASTDKWLVHVIPHPSLNPVNTPLGIVVLVTDRSADEARSEAPRILSGDSPIVGEFVIPITH